MGHGVRDPFGSEDLGRPTAATFCRAVLCKSHGPRGRTAKTETKRTIISRFSRLRQEADWWTCRDLATELLTLDLPPNERAEALFALGFAQEKLGNAQQAIVAYMQSLKVDAENAKAARRIARLESAAAWRLARSGE